MKRLSLIIICIFSAVSSFGVTRQEFLSLMREGPITVSCSGGLNLGQEMTFYPGGYGVWALTPSLSGNLSAINTILDFDSKGTVNIELECDGAEAGCYFEIEVYFDWSIDQNGYIHVAYSEVKENTAKIVKWNTYYVSEQVKCINEKLRKLRGMPSRMIGTSDAYTFWVTNVGIELREHGSSNVFKAYFSD